MVSVLRQTAKQEKQKWFLWGEGLERWVLMCLALSGWSGWDSSPQCVHTPLLFQPSIKSFGTERLIRTSLDLELDLQASKTWHDQLLQEISVLKELKEQLEQAQSQGEKELPQWVKDDERFRLLLRLVEKRVSHTCLGISFHLVEKFQKRDFGQSVNETWALLVCHIQLHQAVSPEPLHSPAQRFAALAEVWIWEVTNAICSAKSVPPVCRRCGVWWLALTLLYITPSPTHRAPSQLLGFLSTSAGTRQRPSYAGTRCGRELVWGTLWGAVFLCMLIFHLKRSIKKIQRECWQKPLFLPQAGRTPYKKLSPLEWLIDKLQFSFCGLWLPESTVSKALRPAAEILLCLEIS